MNDSRGGGFPHRLPISRYAMQRHQTLILASLVLIALLALSGAHPYDRATWVLEVFPVLIALPILWATYRKFPLTTLVYSCIFVHSLVLVVGGNPYLCQSALGFELAEFLDLNRNPYDMIGHFFQGFVPALIAREILIRGRYVRGKEMLRFIVISVVLAISATYELIEWGVATALVLFSRLHDRQIECEQSLNKD